VSAEKHHLTSSFKSASISPQVMHAQLTGLDENRSKDVSIAMSEHIRTNIRRMDALRDDGY